MMSLLGHLRRAVSSDSTPDFESEAQCAFHCETPSHQYFDALPSNVQNQDPYHGDWLSGLESIDQGTTLQGVTPTGMLHAHLMTEKIAKEAATPENCAGSPPLEWTENRFVDSVDENAIGGGAGDAFFF
eukprot:3119300-Rhodomonas_salina.1